jgi:hypothetical protein
MWGGGPEREAAGKKKKLDENETVKDVKVTAAAPYLDSIERAATFRRPTDGDTHPPIAVPLVFPSRRF